MTPPTDSNPSDSHTIPPQKSNKQTGELDLKGAYPEWDPDRHFVVTVLTFVKKIFYMKASWRVGYWRTSIQHAMHERSAALMDRSIHPPTHHLPTRPHNRPPRPPHHNINHTHPPTHTGCGPRAHFGGARPRAQP